MARIPFFSGGFRDDHLEEFVARFLSSSVTLSVDSAEGAVERRILRAFRSDKTGGVSQQGVDVIAKVEGGETWGFECKLRSQGSAKWELSHSKAAVRKATYPADRYFLIAVAKNIQREAVEYVESQEKWQFWDADTLTSQFLTQVRLEDGLMILEEFFGRSAAEECYGLLRDEALVAASRFFEATRKPDRPFNHLAPLVGRRDLVEKMHCFADSSAKKVLLISARGGEGKSRALSEFATEFIDRHPDSELRFVNPLAGSRAEEASMGYLLKKKLVVVHEDAHRLETLRPRVLSAIAGAKHAKIIITARPQAIEAVRSHLRDYGIGVEDIESVASLPPLTDSEMTQLARSVLGPDPRIEPHLLAKWSDRSPIICVVGGNLIRERKLIPWEIPNEESFRAEVFSRFEQQNLDALASGDPRRREWLEELLRTIAVLAPLPDSPELRMRLQEHLGVRPIQLEALLAELKSSELVSETRNGWRVGPDLFADHLVYTACVNHGKPSAFFNEIVGKFKEEYVPNLLRNLSEAEWRARTTGEEKIDLTTALWELFVTKFRDAPYWDRRGMLESWSSFSLFLPERSIELAKLAMADKAAPEDAVSRQLSLEPAKHRDAVERVPAILSAIGIYQAEFREEVFDLLAPLGSEWASPAPFHIREGDNHPWVAIGKAAAFSLTQPLDSVEGVVRWIGSRLDRTWMAGLINQPSSFLPLVLEPVFQRHIERIISEGRNLVFQTIPLSAEETQPARDAAFDLIESRLIPQSEIAALNTIPVLNAAASFWTGGLGVPLDHEAWRPSRLRAIGLLRRCAELWDSDCLRFSVWSAIAGKLPYEKDSEVAEACRQALASIMRDSGLDIALSTLGNDGELLFEEDLTYEPDYESSWNRWKAFHPILADRLLGQFTAPEDLLHRLASFDRGARLRDRLPNWGPLLGSLVSASEPFASLALSRCLHDGESFLDATFGTLIHSHPGTSPSKQDRWLEEAIRSSRATLRRSALSSLQWSKDEPGPKTRAAMVELLNSGSEESTATVVKSLADFLSLGKEWSIRLLDSVSFGTLGSASLGILVSGIVHGTEYRQMKFEMADILPILVRLETLPEIHRAPYPEFLRIVSKISPLITYELVRKRIERFEEIYQEESEFRFHPTPYSLAQWMIPGLHLDPSFSAIADQLLEKVRHVESPAHFYWKDLFRAAILLNDVEKGVSVLDSLLAAATDAETVREIAEIFNVVGSRLVFERPDFVKRLLEKAVGFGGDEERRIRFRLIPRTNGRSYTNGKLDSKHGWLLDEARKATSAHASDRVLRPFFEQVIRLEERDLARDLEEFQNEALL